MMEKTHTLQRSTPVSYTHLDVYKRQGECIMPREGVFAQVLHGGTISVGDTLRILPDEAQA